MVTKNNVSKQQATILYYKLILLKKRIEQFVNIRRELIFRAKVYRRMDLYDNISLKFINNRPELRFRVNRRSIRKKLFRKIRKQVNQKKVIKQSQQHMKSQQILKSELQSNNLKDYDSELDDSGSASINPNNQMSS